MLTEEQKKDPINALRLFNRKAMQAYDNAPPHLKMKVLKSYDIKTPKEEALIQLILDANERPQVSRVHESAVRLEMQKEQVTKGDINTPEREAYWENELQKARQKDVEEMKKVQAERQKQFEGEKKGVTPPIKKTDTNAQTLVELPGIGEKSLNKLQAAHINTVEEFLALSHDQKESIVGPVVAAKFK